jgi:hypothetical protein
MQELAMRDKYQADLAIHIEAMGSVAVAVANRWIFGWSGRVAALQQAGTYLSSLATQVELEKIDLANEPNMRHLSRHEILQIYEIKESPPW